MEVTVMKFGGSSLGDAEALERVGAIIAGQKSGRVVVVSAMGDTTDRLEELLASAEAGDETRATGIAAALHRRGTAALAASAPGDERAIRAVESARATVDRVVGGVLRLGETPPRARDELLAVGESVASEVVAAVLRRRGMRAAAVAPESAVATDGTHGAAVPCYTRTRASLGEAVVPRLAAGETVVLGGFVGAGPDGRVTTLGRGGSDLTASVVARCLGAARLDYYKDVDGILTASPELVPRARTVPRLTFREAAELAYLGARVLHPASIQPAVEASIPVRVLSSYRPAAPGTVICGDAPADPGEPPVVKSIACKRDQLLVNVFSTRMLGASGFLRRVFEVFDRLDLSVDHVATSEVDVTVTLARTPAAERLRRELGEVATVDVRRDAGVISLVGEGLAGTAGAAARIFAAIADVDVRFVTYGGVGTNLSLVVADGDLPAAVARLHDALCLPAVRASGLGEPAGAREEEVPRA